MKRVGIGIIGCGAIAESAHLPNLLSIPAVKIEAVCDIDIKKLEYSQKKFNVQNGYSDFELLLKNKKIDAVVICTPAPTHAEIVLRSIEEGKNVFVEKPITTKVEDAEKIVKAAQKYNIHVMVGYQLRFLPNHIMTRKIIEKGDIGKVDIGHIRAETLVIKPAETILVDYATHLFDLIRWYFEGDNVSRVAGMLYSDIKGDLDLGAAVQLQFSSGKIASIETFWLPKFSWGEVERRVEFLGSEGKVSTDMTGPTIKIYRTNSFRDRILGPKTIMPRNVLHPRVPITDDAYRHELELFINVILKGDKKLPIDAEDGLLALKIAEAAKDSFNTGKFVELKNHV